MTWIRKSIALVSIVVLTIGGLGFGANAAQAQASFDTEATITDLHFTETTVTSGSTAKLEGSWSLPDNPSTPAGFTVGLPEDLQGTADTFDLLAPDGAVVGTCVVSALELTCTFADAYVQENPRDLRGTFSFWVKVTTQVTETTETTYDFDNVDGNVTVNVNPGAGQCPPSRCDFTGQEGKKTGTYNNSANTIDWTVEVPAPAEGMKAGQEVVVTDLLPAGQTLDVNKLRVMKSNELARNQLGFEVPINWANIAATDYTTTQDPITVSFAAEEGAYYKVLFYNVEMDDAGASGTYSNAATVSVAGEETVRTEASVTKQGGGGTGIGTDIGRFKITKEVEGDAFIPADTNYTVNYAVTQPDGTVANGTASIPAGEDGAFTSPTFPKGSTVRLTEVAPSNSTSVTWTDPVFSHNDFTLLGGTEIAVTLTNTATLETGSFSATKSLDGDGTPLVHPDETFTLKYTYPAGDGYPAGEGSLELTAGGARSTSDELPAGAVLTFSEAAPEKVPGTTWSDPVISPGTLTVGEDPSALVTVTNTITKLRGQVSWTKVAPSGTTLTGSEWTLTPESGEAIEVVDNGANDADSADGAFKVTGLGWGEYTLAETKAPAGYVKSDESQQITVGPDTLSIDIGDIENMPEPTPTPSATSSPAPSPSATEGPIPESPESGNPTPGSPPSPATLPITGASRLAALAVTAGVLLLVGGGILIASKRRRLE